MTDNDIKKALECCCKGNHCRSDCPYDGEDDSCVECTSRLAKDALDLINRKEAENKSFVVKQYALKAVIKRYEKDLENAKSEAIKELAERLSDRISDAIEESSNNPNGEHYFITDVYETIDNLVAEMTESPTKIEHSSLCETETYKGELVIVGEPKKLSKKECRELRKRHRNL